MTGIVEGRVVIVTGAARGIGRGHALEFARQGAKVVVNDVGAELDGSGGSTGPGAEGGGAGLEGSGGSTGPAGEVVDAIRGMGGEAVANADDVSSWAGAEHLVAS